MAGKQIPIKVDEKLKAQFEWACAHADTTTSQQIRKHMRDFVNEIFDKSASSIILDGSNPNTITGGMYNPRDENDILTVKRTIWLMRQFEALHPEVRLLPYDEREQIKAAANSRIADVSLAMEDRVAAYTDLMRAHFMRSAMDSLREDDPISYQNHPGFDEYARHYVRAADANNMEVANIPLFDALAKKYPLQGPSCITPGSSYWAS
jgi:hypothetical protein